MAAGSQLLRLLRRCRARSSALHSPGGATCARPLSVSAHEGNAGRRINLNADLAEGYGPWAMTADEELMSIVTSANLACGGHAGDASIMATNLALAAETGVSVGAHPGYDDKRGFGRRVIPMTLAEIEELVAFQTGALLGVAGLARTRQPPGTAPATVTHVKPHGALNNLACIDATVAAAIARAVVGVDKTLIMLAPASSELLHAAEAAGLCTASEVFADRQYMADGNLAPRSMEGSVIHDPQEAVEHALRLASGLSVKAMDTGEEVVLRADSICVHGDKPSAVEQARGVRDALLAEGFTLCTLPELMSSAD
eukprot:COSAG02_NODE_293_length_25438_cov_52.630254_1_plen_312_part_00